MYRPNGGPRLSPVQAEAHTEFLKPPALYSLKQTQNKPSNAKACAEIFKSVKSLYNANSSRARDVQISLSYVPTLFRSLRVFLFYYFIILFFLYSLTESYIHAFFHIDLFNLLVFSLSLGEQKQIHLSPLSSLSEANKFIIYEPLSHVTFVQFVLLDS